MKRFGIAALLVLVLGLAGAGWVAYSYLRPAEQASGPIQTTPVVTSAANASTSGAKTFTIVQDQSQARFTIDEVLNGAPKTVVGTTNQVAGQIVVNPANPSTAQIGTIQINARTLTTDSDQRNNALKNFILQTNTNEFITFTPTAVTGLPNQVATGQAMTFKVTGQLTIKGVSREATFDVTTTAESATRLKGTASTTLKYADWNLSIPSVPFVTGVADQVKLELDFVATA